MNSNLSDNLLSELSEFIVSKIGLHFSKDRWRDLERGIGSVALEFGFDNPETYVQQLLSSPLTRYQIEILASHLTVGETYFFREKKIFGILEERILPELSRSRREGDKRLRIWSAGCATGEEAYSIAILLNKMFPDLKNWNITILATDINPRFLNKATHGLYSEWSFRGCPPSVKEMYFKRKEGSCYEILPHIKRMVTLSYLNLAEDAYPSLLNNTNAMDIIFCRNVLMYFSPEYAGKVIQNLYRSLLDGGWLIVSPSETSHILFSQFATVNFPGVILYKKDSKKSRGEAQPQSFYDTTEIFPQPFFDPAIQSEPEVSFAEPSGSSALKTEDLKSDELQPTPFAEATALYEQGRYAEAAEKLLTRFQDHQDKSKAICLLARALANQGRLAEALEWCEKAIFADRLNPTLYYLHATILEEQGLMDKAMRSMKRVLYLDQHFALAHFALGNIALRLEKFIESKKHFKNALSLLNTYRREDALPESDGMTAGRLLEIIETTISREKWT
jgi:chemotaxis protein methyltransferase CheR